MPEVFPPPKANPITVIGGLIAEFFYSWVVAISESNNNFEDRITTLETTPIFTDATLLNNWVNFEATFSKTGYYKDNSGRVFLRGLIKDGLITPGIVAFNLPAGFRPENSELFLIGTDGNTFPAIDPARVIINSSGDVILDQVDSTFVSFSGVSFLAMP